VTHHRRALAVVLLALAADAVCGWLYGSYEHIGRLHGLYCGLANGVTVGCDVGPQHQAGYVVDAIECALVVPLFAAAISLFTSGLTSGHVAASEGRMKAHLEERLREHLGKPTKGAP
jgi:hypothetical protein